MYQPHPQAIWFWKTCTLQGEVCRVGTLEGEQYQWAVLTPYGQLLHKGLARTLPEAKRAVWNLMP